MLVSDVTIVVVVTMVTTPVFQRRKMLRNTWQYLRKEQDQTLTDQPSAVGQDDGKQSHSWIILQSKTLIRTDLSSQSTKWKDTQFSRSTLDPAYNEQFDAQKCVCSGRVLVVTELINIVVNETALSL